MRASVSQLIIMAMILSSCANKSSNSNAMFHVELSDISINTNGIFVHVAVTNETNSVALLDRYNVCRNGDVKNDLFRIHPLGYSEDILLPYVSVWVNRGLPPYAKSEYLEFTPGEKREYLFNLVTIYDFDSSESEAYSVWYEVQNPRPISSAEISLLMSTKRRFNLSKEQMSSFSGLDSTDQCWEINR